MTCEVKMPATVMGWLSANTLCTLRGLFNTFHCPMNMKIDKWYWRNACSELTRAPDTAGQIEAMLVVGGPEQTCLPSKQTPLTDVPHGVNGPSLITQPSTSCCLFAIELYVQTTRSKRLKSNSGTEFPTMPKHVRFRCLSWGKRISFLLAE